MSLPLTSSEVHVPVASLRDAARHVAALIAGGWRAEDGVTGFRLIRTTSETPERDLASIAPLHPVAVEVHVVGTRNGHSIRLRRVNAQYEVVEVPGVAPAAIFDEPDDQERAALAWERDSGAALGLSMEWTITVDADPSPLAAAGSGVEIRACLFTQTITDAIRRTSLTGIPHLTPPSGRRRAYLALLEAAEPVHLGAITLGSLPPEPPSGVVDEIVLPVAAGALAGEAAAVADLPAGLPRAEAILPPAVPVPAIWAEAVRRLTSCCALVVWCMLASSCTVEADLVHLEFVGFKRSNAAASASDLDARGDIEATLRLRAWTFGDASPDRLLAVRQVTSLYDGLETVASAADILASAEIIYVGLRSDAVAEVVKSARDAQSQVLDSVRQSLKGAQDMAKSAAERFIAALVAIGGVVIANASKALTDHVSRELMLLVALFLIALAAFSLLVEGPLLSVGLSNLKADLKDGASLLGDGQLTRVTSIPSVASTKRKIATIRSVIPTTYAITTLVILVFGYPSHYK